MPAAINNQAPRISVVGAIIGDRNSVFSSPHCRSVANTLKAPHDNTKAVTNARTAPIDPSDLVRLSETNISIIGAALGSIMANIMTRHITNITMD